MDRFEARAATFAGRVVVPAEVEAAFPLFSPLGEKLWVPGWAPELLHPPGAEWEEGQLFRTQEAKGEAVWVVTRLDRASHHAEYHRVEPGRYVARIEVSCRSAGDGTTLVSVTYSYVGLSEEGNREIAAMSQDEHDAKMSRWSGWIRGHLEGRRKGHADPL